MYRRYGPGVVAIVLRCCKCIKNSGRVVILDSGFCVLLLIAALGKFGLFTISAIKKRRHWPKWCDIPTLIALLPAALGSIVTQTGTFLG